MCSSDLSPFPSPFRSPLYSSPFKNLCHATGHCALDLDCDDDDMNLGCFILMFDLILKQVSGPTSTESSGFLFNHIDMGFHSIAFYKQYHRGLRFMPVVLFTVLHLY